MTPYDSGPAGMRKSYPRQALTGARNARLTLEAGFTTVRNVGADGYSDIALRDAINAGDVPGPRMLASGPALSITGGHADNNYLAQYNWSDDGVADGVAGVTLKVREDIKYGADRHQVHGHRRRWLLERELQEKNQRLGEANVELSQRNRELDEFVYVVSHDLQEPLRTLLAFSTFLMKDYGEKLETGAQEYVRYLVDASRRMRAMINGVLNLSRAGKVIGDFSMVDLDELTSVIKSDLGELFRTRSAELRVKSPLPHVWGDRDRIGQLLANLITNAIKYNQCSNPWVEITATTQPGAGSPDDAPDYLLGSDIVIAIRDNGIGIEPEFHQTIFQLFRRLHTHDEYEGTGVGLAICNKIVQAHGGRIWVESTLGQGSTFYISLRSGPQVVSSSTSTIISGAAPSHYENSVFQVSTDEPPTI